MIERATGLILRTRLLTETSLIVHWLTSDLGRIATVAKGARRAKSPFAGKLDLFYLADFSFARSRRSELHTLREVGLRETHRMLRTELGLLRQASYCAALIEQTTETETPLPGVCELMSGLLRDLPAQPPRALTVFSFEMKLLHELGQTPDLHEQKLSRGAQRMLADVTRLNWPALAQRRPSVLQTREIQQFLQGFLIYHLGKVPPGRNAALNG